MRLSGIYTIRHLATGKAYVGRSVDIIERWYQHRSDARRRTTNPLHRALAKYGPEAFAWEIIILAPVEDLVWLEAQFITSRGTMKPDGFNIGGTVGGRPSKGEMALMPPEARERWLSIYREAGARGAAATAAKHQDPVAHQAHKAFMRDAARRREEQLSADPAARATIRTRRAIGLQEGRKKVTPEVRARGAATFKLKMETDPVFAARVRENRARAARARHAPVS